jgi:hypothetical protein
MCHCMLMDRSAHIKRFGLCTGCLAGQTCSCICVDSHSTPCKLRMHIVFTRLASSARLAVQQLLICARSVGGSNARMAHLTGLRDNATVIALSNLALLLLTIVITSRSAA